jgi:hypothetical protein
MNVESKAREMKRRAKQEVKRKRRAARRQEKRAPATAAEMPPRRAGCAELTAGGRPLIERLRGVSRFESPRIS